MEMGFGVYLVPLLYQERRRRKCKSPSARLGLALFVKKGFYNNIVYLVPLLHQERRRRKAQPGSTLFEEMGLGVHLVPLLCQERRRRKDKSLSAWLDLTLFV